MAVNNNLLKLVQAFNREEPEAVQYFTQLYHLEQNNPLELLFTHIAPAEPEFVLGYVQWALNERIILDMSEQTNLTAHFPNEILWCKRFCELLSSEIAKAEFKTLPWHEKLAQKLLIRCLLLYRSDRTTTVRSIQRVLSWCEISMAILGLANQTGDRNIIMPLFTKWANTIQERHELPLIQCPEYQLLDLYQLLPHIYPQDLVLIKERLSHQLIIDNQLLLLAAKAENTSLVEYLVKSGLPNHFNSAEQVYHFCSEFLQCNLPDYLFVLVNKNCSEWGRKTWLPMLLLKHNRLALLTGFVGSWSNRDWNDVEARILQETAQLNTNWLAFAQRTGLLELTMNNGSHSFVSRIHQLIRQQKVLGQYF